MRNAVLTGFSSSSGNGTEPSTTNPPLNDRDAGTESSGFMTSPQVTLTRGVRSRPTPPRSRPACDDTFTPAASRYRNVDFGVISLLSLGDLVWLDANNDGVRQTAEAGIAGVTVTLVGLDPVNAGTLTTTTAADGGYLFTNLVPGRYQVSSRPAVPWPG